MTEIKFLGMAPSPAVERAIDRWVGRLERTYPRIERCSVIIESPHRRHRRGNHFHVRVEIAVPDRMIVSARDRGLDHTHEDVYLALADAFLATRRQLRDFARVRRNDVKTPLAA